MIRILISFIFASFIFSGTTGKLAGHVTDVNGDTLINILDLVQMANYVLEISTPTYECAADFNEDGVVNILDLVQTANYILEN